MNTPQVEYSATRRYAVLVAVGVSSMITTITASMVNVALPTLAEEFRADITTVQWVALIFFVIVSSLHLTTGRYGDIYGRRGAFAFGCLLFALASLACGLAPGLGWLIAARVVVAIGAALLQSNGTAILVAVFPASQRSRALGLWFTLAAGGLALGPPLAGTMIEYLDWRWMFIALTPVALLSFFLALVSVPPMPGTGEGNFDYISSILLMGWIVPLVYSINRGFALGVSPELLLALLVFVVMAAGFAYRTATAPNPLLDLNLFRRRDFSVGVSIGLTGFACMAAMMLNGPFVLERVMGVPVFEIGLYMAIYPGVGALLSPTVGVWADRVGAGIPRTLGFAIGALGYTVFAQLGPETPTIVAAVSLVLIGMGTGLTQTTNNSIIMGSVPRRQLGAASAFISATRTFGFGAGQSAWGGLFAFLVLLQFAGGRAIDAPTELQAQGFAVGFYIAGLLMLAAAVVSYWNLHKPGASAAQATG
ncbi:MAG: MFS transporter [Chloroflexi bacterium]|nr:MFS transporter [Chloroflexota bacterium]MYC46939.1 MFS transporter [Chloroflexota bacterium]